MNGWTLTRVWQVDHELVVAKTIEEAVSLFQTFMGKVFTDEPKNVRAIGTDNYISNYDALIKEETKTTEVKDVDLDKEIDEHWDEWAGKDGFHFKDFAKYFFELGLKLNQKEEQYDRTGNSRQDGRMSMEGMSNRKSL